MTFGFDYHLYNASYHKQKSNIYSYKANNYLNDCGRNIEQIACNPRLVGLATWGLFLTAVNFQPFTLPILTQLISSTSLIPIFGNKIHSIAQFIAENTNDFSQIALTFLTLDSGFAFAAKMSTNPVSHTVLGKLTIFGLQLLLMNDNESSMAVIKYFGASIKNLFMCTGYQLLSYGEQVKYYLCNYFKIDKKNDEILEQIPQIVTQDLAAKISIHEQYVDLYCKNFRSEMNKSWDTTHVTGIKLLDTMVQMGIVNTSISLLDRSFELYTGRMGWFMKAIIPLHMRTPDNNLLGFHNIKALLPSYIKSTIDGIGFMASIDPFISSDYVNKHCGGNVFSLKSINYHIAKKAYTEYYYLFIDALGNTVIVPFKYTSLILYHTLCLNMNKLQQSYSAPKDTKAREEVQNKNTAAPAQKSDATPAQKNDATHSSDLSPTQKSGVDIPLLVELSHESGVDIPLLAALHPETENTNY